MFKMFDESGIFLCACRHGLILLMCDMVQSGELYVLLFSSWDVFHTKPNQEQNIPWQL
jgi:hypothetical protein